MHCAQVVCPTEVKCCMCCSNKASIQDWYPAFVILNCNIILYLHTETSIYLYLYINAWAIDVVTTQMTRRNGWRWESEEACGPCSRAKVNDENWIIRVNQNLYCISNIERVRAERTYTTTKRKCSEENWSRFSPMRAKRRCSNLQHKWVWYMIQKNLYPSQRWVH